MKPVIEIKNLTKTYHTGVIDYKALSGVSFTINAGEMVAIMGPSGSGKSTTMHIIGLLDTADGGEFELNGIKITEFSSDKLAELRNQQIGFVFQSFNLLPRASVAKNVEMPLVYRGVPKEQRAKQVALALEHVGLADKAANMPNQISGGQVQRVAIARAIVGEPAIILADEPTGNLDTKTAHEVMRVFQQMNAAGKTVILITHEQDIADCCNRIITLRDGLVASDKANTKVVNLL